MHLGPRLLPQEARKQSPVVSLCEGDRDQSTEALTQLGFGGKGAGKEEVGVRRSDKHPRGNSSNSQLAPDARTGGEALGELAGGRPPRPQSSLDSVIFQKSPCAGETLQVAFNQTGKISWIF